MNVKRLPIESVRAGAARIEGGLFQHFHAFGEDDLLQPGAAAEGIGSRSSGSGAQQRTDRSPMLLRKPSSGDSDDGKPLMIGCDHDLLRPLPFPRETAYPSGIPSASATSA